MCSCLAVHHIDVDRILHLIDFEFLFRNKTKLDVNNTILAPLHETQHHS